MVGTEEGEKRAINHDAWICCRSNANEREPPSHRAKANERRQIASRYSKLFRSFLLKDFFFFISIYLKLSLVSAFVFRFNFFFLGF